MASLPFQPSMPTTVKASPTNWVRAVSGDEFGWMDPSTGRFVAGEQPPGAAPISRGLTPQQFRQLRSNLGAGLDTPLQAINPATGQPERVYVQMGLDDSSGSYVDKAYFFESDPSRPADASASFAGGYSAGNDKNTLFEPAVIAGLGAITGGAAAPLLGAAGAGALGGGAAGAISTGGDIESIAKGAALGGAAAGLGASLTGGAELSQSAAFENALSGGTGAAGGMPAGAAALPGAISGTTDLTGGAGGGMGGVAPTGTLSASKSTLGPETGTELPAGTSASGATSSPISPQAPAVAADLPVAPTLSESAGLENSLSGGTGASGAMPAGAEALPSSISALGPDAAASLGISGGIPQMSESAGLENALSGGTGAAGGMPAGGATLPSAIGADALAPQAASTLGISSPMVPQPQQLSESGGLENALSGGTGAAGGMPAGAAPLPSAIGAEAGLSPQAASTLGVGQTPLSESAAFENALSGGTGAAGGMPAGAEPLPSSISSATADMLGIPALASGAWVSGGSEAAAAPSGTMPPAIPPEAGLTLPPAVQSIFKQLQDNALALGLIGAAVAAAPGRSQIPNEQQIQGLGTEAQAVAHQLIDQYQSGQLSAGQQAQLDRMMRNARNQLNNYFASIGQSDSTAHSLALGLIDEQGLAMQQQMLDTALQNGLAALGIAQGPLNTIANYQLGQDKALRDAYAQFAAGLGNLFGRSSAAPIQVNMPNR